MSDSESDSKPVAPTPTKKASGSSSSANAKRQATDDAAAAAAATEAARKRVPTFVPIVPSVEKVNYTLIKPFARTQEAEERRRLLKEGTHNINEMFSNELFNWREDLEVWQSKEDADDVFWSTPVRRTGEGNPAKPDNTRKFGAHAYVLNPSLLRSLKIWADNGSDPEKALGKTEILVATAVRELLQQRGPALFKKLTETPKPKAKAAAAATAPAAPTPAAPKKKAAAAATPAKKATPAPAPAPAPKSAADGDDDDEPNKFAVPTAQEFVTAAFKNGKIPPAISSDDTLRFTPVEIVLRTARNTVIKGNSYLEGVLAEGDEKFANEAKYLSKKKALTLNQARAALQKTPESYCAAVYSAWKALEVCSDEALSLLNKQKEHYEPLMKSLEKRAAAAEATTAKQTKQVADLNVKLAQYEKTLEMAKDLEAFMEEDTKPVVAVAQQPKKKPAAAPTAPAKKPTIPAKKRRATEDDDDEEGEEEEEEEQDPAAAETEDDDEEVPDEEDGDEEEGPQSPVFDLPPAPPIKHRSAGLKPAATAATTPSKVTIKARLDDDDDDDE